MFVWADEEEACGCAAGRATRVALHSALASLDRDLRTRFGGAGVLFARADVGPRAPVVTALAASLGAAAVHLSRRYEPAARAADAALEAALRAAGLECTAWHGRRRCLPFSRTRASRG